MKKNPCGVRNAEGKRSRPKMMEPTEPTDDESEDGKNDAAARKGATDRRVAGGKRVPGNYNDGEPEEMEHDDNEEYTVNHDEMDEDEDEEEEEEGDENDVEDDMDEDDEDMEENCKDNMVRHSANSSKENAMKLKVVERDELVDNLITNSESWKYKGAQAVLSRMPDAQLIALNRDWLRQQELEAYVANDYEQGASGAGENLMDDDEANGIDSDDEEGTEDESPGGGEGGGAAGDSDPDLPRNYKRTGKRGEPRGKPTGPVVDGGPDLASGRQGGGEKADDGEVSRRAREGESEYEGDRQPIENVEAWLDAVEAPDIVRNMLYDGLRADMELKANLIETITANKANPYSEDQLNEMTTNQLTPLAKLAAATQPLKGVFQPKPVTNGNRSRIASFIGAQGAPINNRRRAQEQSEDDMLIVPTLNWAEMAEENRKHK